MCLAIPAKVVVANANHMAEVDIHGVSRIVSLDLTPEAVVGDWVMIHAGFAIQVVDEQFAEETWELLNEIQWDDSDSDMPPVDAAASA
jgi:hydrogenase expression/formation protein HypC